jgi:hypothetical protein
MIIKNTHTWFSIAFSIAKKKTVSANNLAETICKWSWRESNPRPKSYSPFFYERSCRFNIPSTRHPTAGYALW